MGSIDLDSQGWSELRKLINGPPTEVQMIIIIVLFLDRWRAVPQIRPTSVFVIVELLRFV